MGKKLTLILLIVISLVLLLGALLIWRWNREISAGQAEAALFQAAQSDQGGVDINSAFIFTFADNVSSASVNKSLTVEPAIELGIHQGASRREVLVAPAEPLTPGALYKFTLKAGGQSYTWAVQTKADLRIMDYSPGDQGIDVPVSGDLTIVLNQMLELDLAKVGDYVTLTPETPGSWTQRGRVLCFNPEQPLLPATVYQVEIAAGLPAAQSSVTLTEGLRFSFETAPAQQDVGWQVSGPASFQSGETPTFSLSLAETPGETAAPPVLAGQLYQYQDADSYVQALLEIAVAKPIWSRGFQELKNCALAGAALSGHVEALTPVKSGPDYSLRWATPLAPGYYLLRLYSQGDSRDLLFAVSSLSAFMVNDSSQTLLWLHDAVDGNPALATVTDVLRGLRAETSSQGLATVSYDGGPAIYQIIGENTGLVLPLWAEQTVPANDQYAWRYLYTDKTLYDNGDTLYFWGLLQPRGDWQLEYEHVSVYLLAEGQDQDDYIYRDLAPLNNGLFNGSVSLPKLRPGAYRLQVWQSGVCYLSRDFTVSGGADPAKAAISASALADAQPPLATLAGDKAAYSPGQSFSVSGQAPGDSWLFIEAQQGVTNAAVGEGNQYLGVFQPKNQLNSYVLGVAWDGSRYYPGRPLRLALDYQAQVLSITLEDTPAVSAGENLALAFLVQDGAGQPLANCGLALQLTYGEKPKLDTAAALFQDYVGSGLSLAEGLAESPAPVGGDTVYWTVLTTDEQGRAAVTLTAPGGSGNCYLSAQSIDFRDNVLRAGSLVKRLAIANGAETETPDQEEPPAETFSYRSGFLRPGGELSLDNGSLLIITTPERREILELLAAAACAPGDGAEQAMSAAHARQLLMDYGGDALRAVFGKADQDCGVYQKADGGVGELKGYSDPLLSAEAAALAPGGLAWHALRDYQTGLLESASADPLSQALALAGLAASGRPVLNEVKQLLSAADPEQAGYWWLMWALYQCGDRQTALALYQQNRTITAKAGTETPRALVAAACGDRSLALALLAQERQAAAAGKVLAARLLLNKTVQPESRFSYRLDGVEHSGSLNSISDHLLSLNGDNQRLVLAEAEEQLCYVEIFIEKPQLAAVSGPQ